MSPTAGLNSELPPELADLNTMLEKYNHLISSQYLMIVNAETPLPENYNPGILVEMSSNPALKMEEQAEMCIRDSYFANSSCRKLVIFPALQNKGAETERIPFPAATKNLVLCQPVPAAIWVGTPDATVKAIVFTIIADLDQAPDINTVAVNLFTDSFRL